MRVLKTLPLAQRVHAPRLRISDKSDRHSTWTELFYDVVFVVAVAAVGKRLAEDVSWRGFAEFWLLFLAVWYSWMGHTVYADRFDSDDLIHRGFTGLQM